MWINIFGIITQFVWQFKAPRQPLGFYICAGLDLREAFKTPLKIYGILELFSLILNLMIYLKIRRFKAKTSISSEPQQTSSDTSKGLFLKDVETFSLSSRLNDLFHISTAVIFFINQALVNRIDPNLINQFPYTFYVYYIFFISPVLLASLSITLYYYRHDNMRRVLLIEIKDFLKRYFYWLNIIDNLINFTKYKHCQIVFSSKVKLYLKIKIQLCDECNLLWQQLWL